MKKIKIRTDTVSLSRILKPNIKNLHFDTLELYVPKPPQLSKHASPGLEDFAGLHRLCLRSVSMQGAMWICNLCAYSALLIQSMTKHLTILAPLEDGGSTTHPKRKFLKYIINGAGRHETNCDTPSNDFR